MASASKKILIIVFWVTSLALIMAYFGRAFINSKDDPFIMAKICFDGGGSMYSRLTGCVYKKE